MKTLFLRRRELGGGLSIRLPGLGPVMLGSPSADAVEAAPPPAADGGDPARVTPATPRKQG